MSKRAFFSLGLLFFVVSFGWPERGETVNPEPNLNTHTREYSPFASKDGSKSYSDCVAAFELMDIRLSEWQGISRGVAISAGFPINAAAWDHGPCISSGGLRVWLFPNTDTSQPDVQDMWARQWVEEVSRKDAKLLYSQANSFLSCNLVQLYLPASRNVRLTLYDMMGRPVRILADGAKDPGSHIVLWEGRNEKGEKVKSGIYFYCLSVGNFRQIGKMALVR